ncbi:spore coat associated protein CotJA [Clostridium sp. Marseille-P2415]|uniref:spore coat associated protein CotJA n=1 Tax=Clostridium sp. Marseille-P2415 TaxID=1805471 RepID=UPI001F244DDA|nr:spore coat associated protein CotJA [Clostridium sp. Marseille-P2415]
MKRPEMPMGFAPAKCPRTAPSASYENIDKFPVAMAYVPWQRWQQVYPVETALGRGTIFPDLDKPFIMEGCR